MDRHIGSTSNGLRGSRISDISYDHSSDPDHWICYITTTGEEYFDGEGDTKGEALAFALDYWASFHADFKNQAEFDEWLRIKNAPPPPPSEAELEQRRREATASKAAADERRRIERTHFSYILTEHAKFYGWLTPLFIIIYVIFRMNAFDQFVEKMSAGFLLIFVPILNWLVILGIWVSAKDGSSEFIFSGLIASIIAYLGFCAFVKASRS